MIRDLGLAKLAPYGMRQRIKALPGVLPAYFRLFNRSKLNQLTTDATLMCMEGYPRSGNSFSFLCVTTLLGVPSHAISHHTHSPVNVSRAVKRKLPTYVFVREPKAAAISLLLYGVCKTLEESLQAYEDFYRPLASLLDRVVVIPFEDLIKSPADFLNRVADDLKLERVEWTDATAAFMEEVVRRADEQFHVEKYARNSLPTTEKDQQKAEVARNEMSPQAQETLERCTALRDQILQRAAPLVSPG